MRRDQIDLPSWLEVSAETLDRLCAFCALVEKWNPAVNLISKSGLPQLWSRHVLDSAQIMRQAPVAATSWCDLGSGGGFPGIIIAILASEKLPAMTVTLVESDRRKAVFLSEALRHLGITATVRSERIESLQPQQAEVLSARALAPLVQLCDFASRHLSSTGVALFPKGAGVGQEIADAQKHWAFDCEQVQSLTDPTARIVALRNIRHA